MRINPAFDLHPAQQNDPAKIDKVARQLEGQFAQMLVKSMRDASFGDSLFPGENKMFRDMYDQKIAEAMTRGKGLGLSGMISRQLSGQAADGPALDTRVDPAKASRAYQLNAPAKPAPSLPLEDGSQAVRLLQQMAAGAQHGAQAAVAPMEQALDLIAGRESSSMHRSLGTEDPYIGSLQGEDWAANSDQWSATASNRGTAISPADAMATRTAVAQLGEHTRKVSSPASGSTRRARPRNWAWMPARWSPRPRWKPAGASATSSMPTAAPRTTCSASRPMAGTASAPWPAPTSTSMACAATRPPASAPTARRPRASPTTCAC
jgi:Rod binding domain-containing protein